MRILLFENDMRLLLLQNKFYIIVEFIDLGWRQTRLFLRQTFNNVLIKRQCDKMPLDAGEKTFIFSSLAHSNAFKHARNTLRQCSRSICKSEHLQMQTHTEEACLTALQ